MKQLKRTLLTLVALLALTAQTWAADLQVTQLTTEMISSWKDVNVIVTLGDLQALGFVEVDKNVVEAWTGAPTSGDAYLICGFTTGDLVKIACFNDGKFEAWADAAAKSIVYQTVSTAPHYIITASGTPFPITWSAETPNTASIAKMPAGNVTVNVDYFPQAEFAMSTDATPVALAPAPIPGVPANTDGPIVTAGAVANIGDSEVKQGTLMYCVKQTDGNTAPEAPDYDDKGWTDKVPTANGLAQGDAYVWYYIKGAEPDNIADRSDANTRSDSDIKPLGATGYVTLDAEPTYDVSLNKTGMAEGEPAKWSAKSTNVTTAVNLGTNDLKGVKKGETVTVIYSGSKKIIGVKAEKAKTITIDGDVYTVLNGETWSQFITRNQLSWSFMQSSGTKLIVYKDDPMSSLYVSSDGTLLELTSEDAPIDTDKQYYWEDALP